MVLTGNNAMYFFCEISSCIHGTVVLWSSVLQSWNLMLRNSRTEVFFEKLFLKVSQYSQKNTCVVVSFYWSCRSDMFKFNNKNTRTTSLTTSLAGFLILVTAWKVSVFRVSLVCIFPHLDWIRRDSPYLCVFSPNAGKFRPEKSE